MNCLDLVRAEQDIVETKVRKETSALSTVKTCVYESTFFEVWQNRFLIVF